ncbi:hypothetical protein KVA01_08110 [Kocuria varians]|uniref:Uncharacterized protein n=1 Tax=Kocuria varians TaxID=1272 RepID=A0A4Y4D239_KOCVA|nr:hypothetical protein [Kocuria varians]GEC98656.1 hypothetical protein KVA01_08110 [Kocuria varians]
MTVLESTEIGVHEDPWDSVPVIGAGVSAALAEGAREIVPEDLGGQVVVRCDETGAPREVLHRGHAHRVVEQPVRWYDRRNWWDLVDRVPRESRTSLVDHELWQVQAVQRGAVLPATFRLLRDQSTGWWRLLSVTRG